MRSTDPPSAPNPAAVTRSAAELDLSSAKRFILPKKKSYEAQYAHVYFSRLKALGPVVLATAKTTFGENNPEMLHYAKRIVDISANESAETVIVGVVYRDMKAKPSILGQYKVASDELIPLPPPRSSVSYVGPEDTVSIEDEYGRCTLDLSDMDPSVTALPFATGLVIALKGVEDRSTGSFKVNAFVQAGLAPQPSLSSLPNDKFVCIVSGIAFGSLNADTLSAELFLEFLRGNSGDEVEVADSAAIVQLIVAGNLIPKLENIDKGAAAVRSAHRPLKTGEKERVAAPMVEVDRFLSAAASSLPVALMPGEDDPVNYLLPQQPFHRCLLPSSARNENLSRVPNPFQCSLDKRIVLGTSGQPVIDFALYEKGSVGSEQGDSQTSGPSGERALDIMEMMLSNRHIAPTCPDTLASFPFSDGSDPFVVETTPHIFFSGNQKEFASCLVKSGNEQTKSPSDGSMDNDGVPGDEKMVRVVSVPRFDETGQAVLVNLRTLDCTVREFALTM